MDLLFVKGDKGLNARLYGKMYFPSRNSLIKQEGLYSCMYIRNKGTYSFADGVLKGTLEPDENYLVKYVREKMAVGKHFEGIYVKRVGEQCIAGVDYGRDISWGHFEKDEKGEQEFVIDCNEGSRSHISKRLMEFPDALDIKDVYRKAYMELVQHVPEDKIMRALAAVVSVHRCSHFPKVTIKSVTVFDSSAFIVNSDWKGKCLSFDKDGNVIPEMDSSEFIRNREVKEYSYEEIEKYMIENNIGFPEYFNNGAITCVKHLDVCGNHIEFEYFNGRTAMKEYTEEDKQRVEKSFEEVQMLRKALGKNLSKQTMLEITRLTDKKLLMC